MIYISIPLGGRSLMFRVGGVVGVGRRGPRRRQPARQLARRRHQRRRTAPAYTWGASVSVGARTTARAAAGDTHCWWATAACGAAGQAARAACLAARAPQSHAPGIRPAAAATARCAASPAAGWLERRRSPPLPL